jgi:Phage tail tube protein
MVDCQVSQIQWTGGAGQALSALVDWVGLSAILGATDPVLAVSSQAILVYPMVTATYGGVHDGSVQSFQITVNQNRTPWVGDTGVTAFDIVPGKLQVTAQLVMLFQNDQEYRNFLGGTTSATAPAVTIPSKALSIVSAIDANHSIQWDLAAAQITAYSRGFGTDGAPLLATIQLKSKKDVTTIGNVVTVTTKNDVIAP